MSIKLILALVLLGLFQFSAHATEFGTKSMHEQGLGGVPLATATSVIGLLSRPNYWNGKQVSVAGFIQPDIHGTSLFVSSEWCKHFDTEYAVVIDIQTIVPAILSTDLPTKPCQLATVEGQFDYSEKEPPAPNTILVRDRFPGTIRANYILVHESS